MKVKFNLVLWRFCVTLEKNIFPTWISGFIHAVQRDLVLETRKCIMLEHYRTIKFVLLLFNPASVVSFKESLCCGRTELAESLEHSYCLFLEKLFSFCQGQN